MVSTIDEKVESFYCHEEQSFHLFEEENWVDFYTYQNPSRSGTYNVTATGDAQGTPQVEEAKAYIRKTFK